MDQTNASRPANKTGWIVIIILIIAIAAGAYWMITNQEKTTEVAPGQTLVTAPEGKTVSNFPAELMQEQNTAIEQSFSINNKETGASQPVVEYVSVKSLADNIAIYRQYLSNNGWNITHEANPAETPVTFFYAVKDQANLNIVFAPKNGQVTVTVAYANKI